MTPLRRALVWSIALIVFATAHAYAQDEYDFAITPAFLQGLADGRTILPTFRVHIDARSDIKDIAQDCEVHLAGTFIGQDPGDPDHVVTEPPNECRYKPGVTTPSTPAAKAQWRTLLDSHVVGKDCSIVGFPRIFTEHADSGSGASNPNHVFEFHPALRIACDGQTPLEFFKALAAPNGLRHITPVSAASCLSTRELAVRFKNGQYEFKQSSGQGCGNFVIVEVGALNGAWIRATGGGHSAIARVSADGTTRESLKLYTLEGTAADDWLVSLMPPAGTAPKISTKRNPATRRPHVRLLRDGACASRRRHDDVQATDRLDADSVPSRVYRVWRDADNSVAGELSHLGEDENDVFVFAL
jgi:hypothetical protein